MLSLYYMAESLLNNILVHIQVWRGSSSLRPVHHIFHSKQERSSI